MANTTSCFSKPIGFWTHVLTIPLFTLGFLLLYRPYRLFMNSQHEFPEYSFHITMIMCIILVVTILSRLAMILLYGKIKLVKTQYYFWEFVEMVVASAFAALYLWLIMRRSAAYFEFFGYSLVYLCPIIAIPDIIIAMYFEILEKEALASNSESPMSVEKVRFLDERGNLKLIVSAESLLYIQADENYLKICYLDSGKIMDYSLRASMKSIEELCQKYGLIRCHRSYYVNRLRVKVLKKDKEEVLAILDVPNAKSIPVSKNYYNQLSSML